ncbi:alpha/beta fold hydrolase [Salsipaludibacter albus]|uniref:alpha/beta fold hydrolase n=1 Tax=Salsipaludibacter albus TaxID=2849650 RepID=UPI001EE4D2C4|nr:alpha/beta hydrolase [Salsipaludibacter albus]MBY5160927.1 alpha/beta hydrolase [Salsipaludibacter albus]
MGVEAVAGAERRVWEEVGATPVEHRLDLASVGTTVRVQEVGSGPPAVFLHGTSVAGTSWADLAAALPDVRCILVDRPGCGGSDPLPGEVDLDRLLAVGDHLVADVLDELGLATAAVVATSRGGLEALRGAAAHPDRVERLLLFGWCLGTPGTRAPWWIRAGALPGAGRMMAAVPMSRRNVDMTLRRFGLDRALDEGGMSAAALDWLVTLYGDTETLRHESAASAALLTLRDGWRDVVPRDRLAAVRAPTRVVWGDEDPFGDEATARRLADALPDADLHVLERAGHAPWLDRLATCTELARTFLVDHEPED